MLSPDLFRSEVPLSLGKHFVADHELPDSSRAQQWGVVMSVQLPVLIGGSRLQFRGSPWQEKDGMIGKALFRVFSLVPPLKYTRYLNTTVPSIFHQGTQPLVFSDNFIKLLHPQSQHPCSGYMF